MSASPASAPPPSLLDEVEEQHIRGSGPGGQHRNKRQTGVRLVHRPSGLVAQATERRSQAQNRATAAERLQARLDALAFQPPPRRPTRPSAAARRARLEAKRRRGERKAARRQAGEDG